MELSNQNPCGTFILSFNCLCAQRVLQEQLFWASVPSTSPQSNAHYQMCGRKLKWAVLNIRVGNKPRFICPKHIKNWTSSKKTQTPLTQSWLVYSHTLLHRCREHGHIGQPLSGSWYGHPWWKTEHLEVVGLPYPGYPDCQLEIPFCNSSILRFFFRRCCGFLVKHAHPIPTVHL